MIYKCKPARVELYNNTGKKTAAQVKAATGCDIVFNGGLYDMSTFKACCDMRIGGVTLNDDQYTYWGYGWKRGALPQVLASDKMSTVDDYISCLWAIHNGVKEPIDNNAPGIGGVRGRAAFGFTAAGEMVILCVADGSGALSLTGTRDALYNAGCVNGIILDGGGSSQIICPAGTISSARIVSNLVCVWLNNEKEDKPVSKKKVCLDPGHGLAEAYNQSPDGTYKEYEFTLDMGKRLRAHLERCGFEVMMTREDNSTPGLTARATMANNWGADLFVSLHSNADNSKYYDSEGWGPSSGFTVWIYDYGGAREAAAKLLIEEMKAAGVKVFGQGIFPNKTSITVLKATNMPAILPEYLFHTNRTDVPLLKDSAYREKMAVATAKAICKHFSVTWIPEASPEPTPEPEPETPSTAQVHRLYEVITKVQLGAWNDLAKAEAYKETLEAEGKIIIIISSEK